MRMIVFTLILLSTCCVTAQWRVSLTYFQDTTYFNGAKPHPYDATDLFDGWMDYVRVNGSYAFSEKSVLDGWMDVDDSFAPKSFKLGYQRWFNEYFYAEVVGMKQALPAIRYDLNDAYSGHVKFYGTGLFGAGGGARKSIGRFEFAPSFLVLKGIHLSDRIEDLILSDSNLKSYQTQEFIVSNIWSTNIEIATVVQLFQRSKVSGGLMYKFVWRRDRFNYSNEVEVFEWTIDNKVIDEVFQSRHAFDHVQHQIGIIIRKK
jgi:hypothetical protein